MLLLLLFFFSCFFLMFLQRFIFLLLSCFAIVSLKLTISCHVLFFLSFGTFALITVLISFYTCHRFFFCHRLL